jgi:hypothetical protein
VQTFTGKQISESTWRQAERFCGRFDSRLASDNAIEFPILRVGHDELAKRRFLRSTTIISPWIKVSYTLFVCVLVPVYWVEYGPKNFLWGSDIALFVTLLALWTGNRLLASMMALAVLVPEVAWSIDFTFRFIIGPDAAPMPGTQYMFDSEIPLFVRVLSLFHVILPVLLVWLVYRLGYERQALLYQTLLLWIVLPLTYFVTDPSDNINWVYGFGREPQTWMPGTLYLALLMLIMPLCFYLPTHLLLGKLFGGARK